MALILSLTSPVSFGTTDSAAMLSAIWRRQIAARHSHNISEDHSEDHRSRCSRQTVKHTVLLIMW